MCLDVLRAIAREPEAARAVLGHLAQGKHTREVADDVAAILISADAESHARKAVERLALLAAASALAQCAPNDTPDLFMRTRLQDRRESIYGSSAIDDNSAADMLRRAVPS
jgi:putative acyl-CoA dehydrogenase